MPVSVITGANSGIGLETARALSARGDRVLLVCRSQSKAEQASQEIAVRGGEAPEIIIGDLSSASDVKRIADQIIQKTDRIDVLVNNAGAHFPSRMESVDGIEMNLALNHLAYFRLTSHLLPILRATDSARIINVASRAHRVARLDFKDLEFSRRRYKAFTAYGTSKLMNILFTRQFAELFGPDVATVNAVHPGVVRTGFGHDYAGWFSFLARLASPFMVSAQKGAETTVHLAMSDEVTGITGKYFSDKRQTEPKPFALDLTTARKLWAVSEEYCGFVFGDS